MRQTQDINNTNDPQKKYPLGTVSKNVLLEGLNPLADSGEAHPARAPPKIAKAFFLNMILAADIVFFVVVDFFNHKKSDFFLARSARKCI